MQFGPVSLAAAEGAILAHSLKTRDGTLRKGRVLTAADVETLHEDGHTTVMVARLDDTDVAEDDAAHRIAQALAGTGTAVGEAFTGRANVYASEPGVMILDAERIASVNVNDETITVATLAPFSAVSKRQMLATVKIIPFAAPKVAVETAERLLQGAPALAVARFVPKHVALISTALAGTRESILDKNRLALDARLKPMGSQVVFERRVPHAVEELVPAIRDARSSGADPILLFGASAITDRRDVLPAALEAAGGCVTRFGMPVDPGNLLLLGHYDGAAVIGLPGCARSPKLNGFDFILQRVLADLPLHASDIAAMGVGGLLTEIPTRPQPRDRPPKTSGQHAPRIAAIILAAGLSSRMGSNKLAAMIGGKPLLRRVAETATGSSAEPVIVVTGSEPELAERLLQGLPIRFVANPDYSSGLSSSLIRGIDAVPHECDGAVVLLGDMPLVSASTVNKLIAAFAPEEGRAICVATHRGKRGNPVLWASTFFSDMRGLTGDVGAKSLIAANAESVCEVEMPDEGPLLDIDTPDALAAYAERFA